MLAYRVVEVEEECSQHWFGESPLRESVSETRGNEKPFLGRQTMSK